MHTFQHAQKRANNYKWYKGYSKLAYSVAQKNLDMSMTMAGNSRGSFNYVSSNFQANLIQEAFGDA